MKKKKKKIILFWGIQYVKASNYSDFIETEPSLDCLFIEHTENTKEILKADELRRVALIVINFQFVDVSGETGKLKEPHTPDAILKKLTDEIPRFKGVKKIVFAPTTKDIALINSQGGIQDPTVINILSIETINPEFFYNEVVKAIA